MTRIPNSFFPNSLVGQLNQLLTRQNELQTQAATGQRVQNPDDDPVAVRQALRQETRIRSLEQYQRNIDKLDQQGRAAYASIRGLQQICTRAGEIATLADGTKSPQDLRTYAAELSQLIQRGVDLANGKFQGDYIFGGTRSDRPPFVTTSDATGQVTSVNYQGNSESREVEISEGSSVTMQGTGANTTGNGPCGLITDSRSGADFFAHLISLRDHLLAGDTASIANVDRAAVNRDQENFLSQITENGAVQARLEVSSAAITQQVADGESAISNLTSADLAETLVRLTQAQTAYRAALQSGAQIMQQSLMDFLR